MADEMVNPGPEYPDMNSGWGEVVDASVDEDEPVRRSRPVDPWAHRRGEPRLFAFLWTLFLFVTVMGSLLWLTRSGVLAASAYGPAARVMLIVISAGSTILWPMVRLSQAAPSGSIVGAVASDLMVIVIPIQVVVWPLAFLASWPISAVAVVAGMMLAWPFVTGGVLTTGQALMRRMGRESGGALDRIAWMMVCVAMVGAAPIAVAMTNVGDGVAIESWLWRLSPFTFVYVLTGAGLRGPHAPIGWTDWLTLAPVVGVGVLMWLVGAGLERGGPRGTTRLDSQLVDRGA